MIGFPLAGNGRINETVTNFLKEKRLPHAILIEGDTGTGRHTLANYIAKASVCESDFVPCGDCRGCRVAESGNHPDISVIAPEENKKNITVAQIRNLKEDTVVKPHIAEVKVFILDRADTMNEQSQNALLKVLEEPPGSIYFILIAESKSALLDTIISRCVVLTLSNPETETAVKYISQYTDYPVDDIKDALKSADNNIGKALLLLSGESDTEISLVARQFLDFMFENNTWGMMRTVSDAQKNRLEADRFFKELKYQTAVMLRKKVNSYMAKPLSRFYSEICTLEKSLIANINLNLLFCTLVSTAEQIGKL